MSEKKDYEKKLKELEKQRKQLYEEAKQTNKITEKVKYKQIKEDLKKNQTDIIIFTKELEEQENAEKKREEEEFKGARIDTISLNSQ